MTGPEHYQEAERLLATAQQEAEAAGAGPVSTDRMEYLMQRAQVHATLAQAAATGLASLAVGRGPDGSNTLAEDAWMKVAL